MRKFPLLVSGITLILGFAFYGEHITINIGDTYYVIPSEVVLFCIWFVITIIYWLFQLKRYLSRHEA
ncbi:hypothetical protein [Christiangramia portivictoriae]|uniref:hypothetical protein n=1 Tax=Christiangramia portivictoriae TaxID=326069 RepID=UPI00047AA376|nr:hypothetical protein [Christiangramia portivictoriae]